MVCGNALGYTITQTSTSFSNVLANAMEPYYFKNDYDTHTGMLFISTDVTNEYYVAYFSIDRGQSITIVKLSSNVIDLSAYNDAGSIVLSGGTAPYTMTVKYNN